MGAPSVPDAVILKGLPAKALPLKQTVSPAFAEFTWEALVALTVHFEGVIGRTPAVPSGPHVGLPLTGVAGWTGTDGDGRGPVDEPVDGWVGGVAG